MPTSRRSRQLQFATSSPRAGTQSCDGNPRRHWGIECNACVHVSWDSPQNSPESAANIGESATNMGESTTSRGIHGIYVGDSPQRVFEKWCRRRYRIAGIRLGIPRWGIGNIEFVWLSICLRNPLAYAHNLVAPRLPCEPAVMMIHSEKSQISSSPSKILPL